MLLNKSLIAVTTMIVSTAIASVLLGGPVRAIRSGVWMPDLLVQTDQAPLARGIEFGWQLDLAGHDDFVLREELLLPAAPKHWGTTAATTISADRTTATTIEHVDADTAMIEHRWQISAGDPPGLYLFRVYIDERLVVQRGIFFDG